MQQAYKEADERRILKYRELMMEYINIDMKVKPLIQKCLEGMEKAAGAIDPQLVIHIVSSDLCFDQLMCFVNIDFLQDSLNLVCWAILVQISCMPWRQSFSCFFTCSVVTYPSSYSLPC